MSLIEVGRLDFRLRNSFEFLAVAAVLTSLRNWRGIVATKIGPPYYSRSKHADFLWVAYKPEELSFPSKALYTLMKVLHRSRARVV